MNENEIKQKLDKLSEFQAQRDTIQLQKQALIDKILTDEIKAKLSDINAEFSDKTSTVDINISSLEADIKNAVEELGTSVKGTLLHAVWSKGRVSWDNKAMDGYAVDHPEILFMRKEGNPFVSIKKV